MRAIWQTVKAAFQQLWQDDAPLLAAALSYYTSLSLAPLLLLLVWALGSMGPDLQQRLVNELVQIVGPDAGETIRSIAESAGSTPSLGSVAGLVGIVTLLVGATGVFAQLQKALDIVWNVRPRKRKGVWGLVRKRLLSLGMILAIGFLLLVSLALSAALALLGNSAQGVLPGMDQLWGVANFVVSLAVISALFAAIFRFLPDVRLDWRDVIVGAVATAALFAIGKVLLGVYLGRSSVGSAYGAAGSLIVLLVWVYYSALILLLGAELTQVYAARFGGGMNLEEHAEWADGGPRRAVDERGERACEPAASTSGREGLRRA